MLRQKLQARLKELAAVIKGYSEKEGLTAEELAQMEASTKEISDIENRLAALDAAEQAAARTAQPANSPAEVDPAQRTAAEPKVRLIAAHKLGLLACAMVKTLNDTGARGLRPTLSTLSEMGFDELSAEFQSANFVGGRQRTLNSGQATTGGVLLPEDMSPDIIDILRPNTTFLLGDPDVIPMPTGTYKMPAAASGATAAYRGETKRLTVTEPTFKGLSMSAKLLGAIVPISNQLIRWSLPRVQQWAQNDLSLAMGVKMDYASYFGDGLADTPLGITKVPGTYRVAATGGTAPTVAQVDSDARKLIHAMLSTNLPPIRVEWRMPLRIFQYLQDLRDGNGNHVYPTLQTANSTFKTFPVRITNQIAINGGVTTDESEVLLIAFGHTVFGDTMAMQLAVSDTASVVNGSETIHAFQQGVTLLKAEAEHDFDIKYLEAVATLTTVRWGA